MSDSLSPGARRTLGKVLWVVSFIALALAVINFIGSIADIDALDLPGPGLLYIAVLIAASAGSGALLKE